MRFKKSPLILIVLIFLFTLTCIGFTLFKQNKSFSSKQIVTKKNWLKDPYLRWSYTHMREFASTKVVAKNPNYVSSLPTNSQNLDNLHITDENNNNTTVLQLLEKYKTDAFIVLHDGNVVYERYFDGYKENEPHGMASLSKVFTGFLISELIEEGKLQPDITAETYVKELQGTPFGKATIQQLLDMQVSVEYPTHGFKQAGLDNQDAQLYLASNLLPRGKNYDGPLKIYDMLLEAHETAAPGENFSYDNGSSETLGWVIRTVTGKSLADMVSERFWSQIGAEEDAYYVVDETGVEQASAGLNATARDMARFGKMVSDNGIYDGKQIISSTIIDEIKNIKKYELPVGDGEAFSYHNQWWIPHNEHGGFEVHGSYGQRLFIYPPAHMVIVHFSSNANHNGEIQSAYGDMYLQIAKYLQQEH
ncbi:6-aminohexanoate hydrolase [Bacillus sp. AFS018417]|uniref:serine hydrolase domain-containing protein n=1 Tax=Bacillus sp. AFS018417 TaxID=2033491 RepID=UPI000BF7908E|nr:serine hydrolase [Bacillus sp. AFS018417]PEZ02220.1 6-aminohexanoate hydrolase [Bacillus sp. AFS018417]